MSYTLERRRPGSPKIDPGTGLPYEFKITSSYMTGPCEGGQWTSFKEDVNNVPAIRDLIANGNPDPLSIGDSIWIEPGVKNTLAVASGNPYVQGVLPEFFAADAMSHAPAAR